MKFEVELECEKCGAQGTLPMSMAAQEVTFSVGGKITTNQRCPLCGGEVSAPSGDYVVRDSRLVRVGDYSAGKN